MVNSRTMAMAIALQSTASYLLAGLEVSGRVGVVFTDVDENLAFELGDVDTPGVRQLEVMLC